MAESLTMQEVIEHCDKTTRLMERVFTCVHDGGEFEQIESKSYLEHKQTSKWLRELQKYKDLKEQSRLIELPCGVGDTVWIIAPNYYKCNNRYNCEDYNPEEYLISWCQKNCSKGYQEIGTIQCVIYGIETYNDENSVQIDCLLDVNGNHYRYSIKDIFLTKEEAEAKLKERGAE